jgi:hypothetical protein
MDKYVIVSADEYFYNQKNGEYTYTEDRLGNIIFLKRIYLQ